MAKANPEMLRWTRETAGLTLADAARKILPSSKQGEDKLRQFEIGELEPTFNQLESMARIYHRSLAFFYLKTPPKASDYGVDFRSIPDAPALSKEIINTDILKRDIFRRHNHVKNLLDDLEELEKNSFVGSGNMSIPITEAAKKISEQIGFDLNKYRSKKDVSAAFKYLRGQIESIGIYTLLVGDLGSHHTDISTNAFRGFAISDSFVPFIIVNDNDAKAAYSFTMLHELVHIWLGQTGVSNENYQSDNKIENYCDCVASEILLPGLDLENIQIDSNLFQFIDSQSLQWKVSGSMVAYRLFKSNRIDRQRWLEVSGRFRILYLERKNKNKKEGAPPPSVLKKYSVGDSLFKLVKRTVYDGALSPTKAGVVLGTSPSSAMKILEKA